MDINDYLISVKKQFRYYQILGEKTFNQLNDGQLFWTPNENSNSVAVIVKHLWGNMMSRWTDFLESDGEKEWRMRDEEFESSFETRAEMLKLWEEGWACLFTALESINEKNSNKLVYIRNVGHSVVEAINRQLCHYSYHVGQMVFLAKQMADSDWESLSIPKEQSKAYNSGKFSRKKSKGHFTDEFLKKGK